MLFYIIYHMPLWMPIVITVITVFMWSSIISKTYLHNPRKVKIINNVFSIVAVAGILAITVLNRSGFNDEVILTPFHSFIEAKYQREIYRSMLMNVFLFVPFGICMPYSFAKITLKNILLTVVIALIMSVGIECYQFLFSCGRCETDDVICNTIGAAIGCVSYMIFLKKHKNSSV